MARTTMAGGWIVAYETYDQRVYQLVNAAGALTGPFRLPPDEVTSDRWCSRILDGDFDRPAAFIWCQEKGTSPALYRSEVDLAPR